MHLSKMMAILYFGEKQTQKHAYHSHMMHRRIDTQAHSNPTTNALRLALLRLSARCAQVSNCPDVSMLPFSLISSNIITIRSTAIASIQY